MHPILDALASMQPMSSSDWPALNWRRLSNTTLNADKSACKSKDKSKPKPRPDCLPECRELGSRSCQARCECAACAFCTPVAQQWRTPTGVLLESLTSRTSPPFQFAYNPVDADMDSMKKGLVVEPILTHAWHEATWRCCAKGGRIVDVGGNFGWFTLFSLALGCHVTVFEPVPAFQDALLLGVALNPGFAERLTLHSSLVHDGPPHNFSMLVPTGHRSPRKKAHLGMTAMAGEHGILKANGLGTITQKLTRPSVRLDEVVPAQDLCLLKADVEGYEPQVLHSAKRLLATRDVAAVQVELTHADQSPAARCAGLRMLRQLVVLGYATRQIAMPYLTRDRPLPEGVWSMAAGPWASGRMRAFPGEHATREVGHRTLARWQKAATAPGPKGPKAWEAASKIVDAAFRADFLTFSTNFLSRRDESAAGPGRIGNKPGRPWRVAPPPSWQL